MRYFEKRVSKTVKNHLTKRLLDPASGHLQLAKVLEAGKIRQPHALEREKKLQITAVFYTNFPNDSLVKKTYINCFKV
jgi:hypothetical protein